jgi:hypothetical protein
MTALHVQPLPDEPVKRLSVTMSESVWQKADQLVKLHNDARRRDGRRPLSREQFIEHCLRWAFDELEAEYAETVKAQPLKKKATT